MTPAEVAQVLRLSVSGVRTLAKRGELTGYRVGREWRFLRRDIAQLLGLTAADPAVPQQGPGACSDRAPA
ncbi:helix-turn-helix domain-containing protein [Actinomadura kijaniata]|uniref:helix-turn-helix domain-containing protein n=1 Tax=Actinomadura kijaniata TaxID=46161 RepID=UPI003F198B66